MENSQSIDEKEKKVCRAKLWWLIPAAAALSGVILGVYRRRHRDV